MDFTIQGLLVGLLALAIGLAFAFYGFKLFLILLPIWGFFAGFLIGANLIASLLGGADAGFLATVTGWVVGFILGLVFAVLSYLYYWVAVILLGGFLGYELTYGVLDWLNIFPENEPGLIAFILALIVGAIFAVGFFILQMPAVLVIVALPKPDYRPGPLPLPTNEPLLPRLRHFFKSRGGTRRMSA